MPSSACDWSSDVCSSDRSEEHTSELQSRSDLVCRLLLEKKKKINSTILVLEPRCAALIAITLPPAPAPMLMTANDASVIAPKPPAPPDELSSACRRLAYI